MALKASGILELSYQASGAVSRMRFVVITGDQTVVRASSAGGAVLGVADVDISTDEATAGKGCAVMVHGVAFVESGAAVARNDLVSTDNVGRAVTSAAGDIVVGRALKAASAAGEWIPVLLAGTFGETVPTP